MKYKALTADAASACHKTIKTRWFERFDKRSGFVWLDI